MEFSCSRGSDLGVEDKAILSPPLVIRSCVEFRLLAGQTCGQLGYR